MSDVIVHSACCGIIIVIRGFDRQWSNKTYTPMSPSNELHETVRRWCCWCRNGTKT